MALDARGAIALVAALSMLLVAAAPAAARKSRAIKYVHVGHVGEKGNGAGAFPGETAGVAVDQDCGDVFIADPVQNRIHRFDQFGRFLGFIGQPGAGEGGIDDPHGIEVRNVFTGRQSLDGPPPPCGSISTVVRTLAVTDWGNSRVSFFTTTGGWQGAWCTSDVGGCVVTKSMSPANVAYDPSGGGFDPNPTDVDMSASGSRVWISGASYGTGGGNVREYTAAGAFVRESERVNYPTGPSTVSASAGAAFLWSNGKSQVIRYGLNPASPTLARETSIGEGYATTPGKFGYVGGVEVGREGPFFDELYVVDNAGSGRVQHFDEKGMLRAEIKLPADFRARYLDVRYDGTIYVTGTNSHGAEVYSPGPVVTLRAKPLGGRKVELSGRIRPGHPRTSVKLQRLGQGWERLAKRVPVNGASRFRYVWKAPRKRTYLVKAHFKDAHAFHADRTSPIVPVEVR